MVNHGPLNEEDPYRKTSIVHQWLFGYEVPDTVLLLRKDGALYFLGTKKKVDFLQPSVDQLKQPKSSSSSSIKITLLQRNKEDNNAANYDTLWNEAVTSIAFKNGNNNKKRALGLILKEQADNRQAGGIVGPWENRLYDASKDTDDVKSSVQLVDIASGIAFVMSVKDDAELDLMKVSCQLLSRLLACHA